MQDEKEPMQVTSLNLPKSLHSLLVRAARGKQHKQGGRCSVSALVVEILQRSVAELEAFSESAV